MNSFWWCSASNGIRDSSGPRGSSCVSLRNLVAWVFEIYMFLILPCLNRDLAEGILALDDANRVLQIPISYSSTMD
ncbi:hypothetical protein EPI10_027853 [Gossypium australe]|uniref:Uncharacterized protein n=1 Tax=Gossypium australe TaxID=47621 RepID=A0A5B6UY92_9ROSI|nr:hypothetical protein EPI10_027853 [Gossypium australe]